MARIYTDTRGFVLEPILGASPGWVQARARARLTGISYCLTLTRDTAGITGFTARDIHPAGPGLRHPEPEEVVRTTEALAAAYDTVGEMSGVILLAKDDGVQLLPVEQLVGAAVAAGRLGPRPAGVFPLSSSTPESWRWTTRWGRCFPITRTGSSAIG